MPGDDEVVMAEGVETTVVEETSSSGSPFALIGAGTGGDGEPGSSSGGQGGHPDFGAGPSGVVVDGSTGEVLGAATINPETGVVEQSGVEVTVVEETSSTSESSTPSRALAGSSATGDATTPAGAAGSPADPPATGAPDPAGPFWRFSRSGPFFVTRCTSILLPISTLQGTRNIEFSVRLEARTQSPNGGPVNPHELGQQADVFVGQAMAKYQEELPTVLSLPPFSIIAAVHTLSDAIIVPIARQLMAQAVEHEFRVFNPEAQVRMHPCGTGL